MHGGEVASGEMNRQLSAQQIIRLVTFYTRNSIFRFRRQIEAVPVKRQFIRKVPRKIFFFPDGIAACLVRLPHAVNVAIRV